MSAAGRIAFLVSALLFPLGGGSLMAQPIPPAAKTYFDEAEKAIARKDWPTAKEKIQAGLAVDPGHANMMVNLAHVFLIEGDKANGKLWLDKALKIDPTNAAGLNARALLWVEDGDLKKATDLFLASMRADPTNPTPILNLGDIAVGLGDGINALKYYDLALQLDANNVHALSKLAELNAMTGPAFADKGMAYAQRAMKADPKNPEARAALGRVYAAKKDWKNAVQHLEAAADGMPKDWQIRFALGVALQQLGMYVDAADAFLSALDLNDADPALHLQLGVAYYSTKNPAWLDDARLEFQHVLTRNPTTADKASALYHLALLHDDAGAWDKAIEDYKQALALDRGNVGAANNLGLILARQGKFGEAIPLYRQALKANPDFAAARLNLGFALLRTNKAAEGKAELQKLLKLPDGDPLKEQARKLIAGTK